MQKYFQKREQKEQGAVEVEATIILPIAILSVILLLYLSLFLFQRANLQACLETCLISYKNVETDAYVKRNEGMSYEETEDSRIGTGNSYEVDGILLPYRGLFRNASKIEDPESFEKYFHSVSGSMLFNDDVQLTLDYTNYVIFKQLEVTATQDLAIPIDMSILGINGKFRVSAAARVSVIDHDDTIRNVDYAIDLIEDSPLGELAGNVAGKVAEYYNKIKEILKLEW